MAGWRAQGSWESLQLLVCASIVLLLIHGRAAAAPSEDRIWKLPGQPNVSFAQYSGFVTVDEDHGRALFYYLTEAVINASSKPLVLWLNGGPGCSSLGGGGLSELGPFYPNGYGDGLIVNNYSWNLLANILFLESPAGVGFSYSNSSSDLDSWNDAKVADDSLVFLLKWLEKFPEYMGRDFYITGESYAGHYIPDLATLIVAFNKVPGNHSINLKGLAIGNPLFDLGVDTQSTFDFVWSHGLVSEQTHNAIVANCNWDDYTPTEPDYNETNTCVEVLNVSFVEMDYNYINPYDVLVDICLPAAAEQELTLQHHTRKSITQTSLGIDVCILEEETLYLNSPKVQEALHVPGPVNWTVCSDRIGRGYQLIDLKREIIPILRDLVQSGLQLLVFSGDQDSVIPLLGTRQLTLVLADDLALQANTTYQSWFVDRQIAGWFQVFGQKNEVTYATVRGAAHMVPLSQPARALQLFQSFLANEKLPTTHPQLPDDGTPSRP